MSDIAPKAAKKAKTSLQDEYYATLSLEQTPISVFLVNGVRLSGVIVGTDPYTILVGSDRAGAPAQMVYKAAISTVCPNQKTIPRIDGNARG